MADDSAMAKACRTCGEWKPLEQYHRDRNKADGRVSRCVTCSAEAKRQYRYSLSPEDYLRMWFAQGGQCGICRTPHHELEQGLMVDHDHGSGAVRLLLCGYCNTLLGYAQDNAERLRKAAEYIELFSSKPKGEEEDGISRTSQ